MKVQRRPLTMWRIVEIRTVVLRLRRRRTWAALLRADRIEQALLSRMSWTR